MIETIDNLLRQNKWEKYLTKKYFDYVIVIFFGVLGLILDWDTKMILALMLLVWFFLNPMKSQLLAKITILLLVLTALMLYLKQIGRADQIAEASYFLMVFTAATSIYELNRETKTLKIKKGGK